MQHVGRLLVLIKRLLIFVVSILFIGYIYVYLLPDVWRNSPALLSIVFVWVFTAYIALPRAHRLLSRLYLPSYFLGRARTADGLLADPVNLAINANKHTLKKAMKKAGWELADPLSLKTMWRIGYSSVIRKSYPKAPVSDMFLFGQKQDLAYQKEVKGNPRQRHHVRFWKVPQGWHLQGGYKVDWLGAATYDDAVGVSVFTLQLTHSIDANVDEERDFLIKTLEDVEAIRNTTKINHFFNQYQAHNMATGGRFLTDGSFVIADLATKDNPSQAQSETSHMNLYAMQQEISHLRKAQNKPITQKSLKQLGEELGIVAQSMSKRVHHKKNTTKKAVKTITGALALLEALGNNADKEYRKHMDEEWKHIKDDE